KRWIALLIVLLLFVFSTIINSMTWIKTAGLTQVLTSDSPRWTEKVLRRGNVSEKIAVLEIHGIIQDQEPSSVLFNPISYQHRLFLQMLDYAAKDPLTQGIILRVNSPGGG